MLAEQLSPQTVNTYLSLLAALTGMRWGELVALRWDDPRFDQPWTTARYGGRAADRPGHQ
jgi:integrase